MSYASPYAKYKTQAVTTLTPGELIVFLYDEMALRINRAILYIQQNKLEDAHKNILKAEDIVLYLAEILDTNYPIADKLLELYEFIYFQLVKANGEKSPHRLEDVLRITGELKDAWQQAEGLNRQKAAWGGKSI